MKSSRTSKYQYVVEMVAVVSLAFENFDFVNVSSTLEQRGKKYFLRTDFSLAIVDSGHRCF